MITVVCVLKTGGSYDRSWVWALKRGLNRHLKGFQFYCLTDDLSVESYWRIPLRHRWKGYWSKLELFRGDLFQLGTRILYLDLDTVIVGDLSEIAGYRGGFAMINDLWQGRRLAASGVMAWEAGSVDLYDRFLAEGMPVRSGRSDPWYNAAMRGRTIERLQDHYPGQIVSLKPKGAPHPSKQAGPPAGARLVCGHGRPRLADPSAGWAHLQWKSLATKAEEVAA